MSAINFNYNTELFYSEMGNNIILLRDRSNDEIVYKFPFPKGFNLIGNIDDEPCIGRQTQVVAPYKLNEPKFIPKGFGNLTFNNAGVWCVDDRKDGELFTDDTLELKYIDTTILSVKDFDYISLGRFKIKKEEIPEPFWLPNFSSNKVYGGWIKPSEIPQIVGNCHPMARLIYEEELMSVFAFNDYGMKFWLHLPENIYDDHFFKDPEKWFLCANEICLDNWDIVVASRENRNVYRDIYREKTLDFEERFWCRNKPFLFDESKDNPFHVFPILDSKSKMSDEEFQLIKKKCKYL